jgi:predicted CopG family antitoxin
MAPSTTNIGFNLHAYRSLLKLKKKKKSSNRKWTECKIQLTKALWNKSNQDEELRKENFETRQRILEYSRNLEKTLNPRRKLDLEIVETAPSIVKTEDVLDCCVTDDEIKEMENM